MSDQATATYEEPGTALAPAQPPEVRQQGVTPADYAGIASAPFSDAEAKIICVPITAKTKEILRVEITGDGRPHMPGVWYREKLIEAFGPGGWALRPTGPVRIKGRTVVWPGALFVRGRFAAEAMGECDYQETNAAMSYGDAVEGAKTNCLTRCCKDVGMALELWDKTFRDDWKGEYAESAKGIGYQGRAKTYWRKKGRPWGEREAEAIAKFEEGEKAANDPGAKAQQKHLDKLEDLALKVLKWDQLTAGKWLKKYFGTNAPGELTNKQALQALQLLGVLKDQGEAAYQDLAAKFLAGEAVL